MVGVSVYDSTEQGPLLRSAVAETVREYVMVAAEVVPGAADVLRVVVADAVVAEVLLFPLHQSQ